MPMSELDRRIGDVLREQPPAPPEMAGRLRRADVWRTKGMTLAGHAPAMEKRALVAERDRGQSLKERRPQPPSLVREM